MKIAILLVLAFVVSSCASSLDQTKNPNNQGHQQPIEVEARHSMEIADPCKDSLFLVLQDKPYSAMTAYEHAYFQQKWDECNGTPEVNHGSTPEWILAWFDIVGVVLALVIAGLR